MSWCFWCNHSYINIFRWYDLSKMDIKSMSEH